MGKGTIIKYFLSGDLADNTSFKITIVKKWPRRVFHYVVTGRRIFRRDQNNLKSGKSTVAIYLLASWNHCQKISGIWRGNSGGKVNCETIKAEQGHPRYDIDKVLKSIIIIG